MLKRLQYLSLTALPCQCLRRLSLMSHVQEATTIFSQLLLDVLSFCWRLRLSYAAAGLLPPQLTHTVRAACG